jgi:hypothetical protein
MLPSEVVDREAEPSGEKLANVKGRRKPTSACSESSAEALKMRDCTSDGVWSWRV